MPGLFSLAHFSLTWLLILGGPATSAVWQPFLRETGTASSGGMTPNAMLVLPTGRFVIADGRLGRLWMVSETGKILEYLQGPGNAVVEWTALALKDGLSFLALDGPQGHVHQFDQRGNYLGIALDLNAVAEAEDLGSVEAFGMAVDTGGNIVITDQLSDRILVFSPGWVLTGVWGESGSGVGQFLRPGAVAAASKSYLVSDRGNSRLVQLDEFGDVLGIYPCPIEPGAVASETPAMAAVLGDTIQFFDRDLIPSKKMALPQSLGCRGKAFAPGALLFHALDLYVGEGCTGGVYRLPHWLGPPQ